MLSVRGVQFGQKSLKAAKTVATASWPEIMNDERGSPLEAIAPNNHGQLTEGAGITMSNQTTQA
jgi:hypothetical protein